MDEKALEPYIWPVLDKIEKKSRRTPKGDLIILFYYVNRPEDSDLSDHSMNVVYLLKQWGAIKIQNKENLDDEIRFYILLDTNFKLIYEEYKDKRLKEQLEAKDYPLELNYSGNTLTISGSAIEKVVTLVHTQSEGSGLLLDSISKICKSKPTAWHKLDKKSLGTSMDFLNKVLSNNLNEAINNPTKFSKYLTGIGLKKPIRQLFVAKASTDLKLKFRLAVPNKDWDNLSIGHKKEVVKYLTELASSRN